MTLCCVSTGDVSSAPLNQVTPPVLEEIALTMLKLPHIGFVNLGANSLSREEFREQMAGNKEVLGLTMGVNPKLRFKPFPK